MTLTVTQYFGFCDLNLGTTQFSRVATNNSIVGLRAYYYHRPFGENVEISLYGFDETMLKRIIYYM